MIQIFMDFIEKIKIHGLEYYGIYYSSYPGIVVENNDPDQRGRIKVEVPTILGKGKTLAAWAEPKDRDLAGQDAGSFFPPYVGDTVTMMFEHGNLRFPVYTGGYWARGELPASFKDGYPNIRGWVFKSGQQFIVDEREGKIRILLSNPSGSQLLIDDTDGKEFISIVHKSGSKFTIDEKSTVTILSSTGSSLVMDGETGECFFRTKDGAELRMNEILTIQEKSGSGKITISESLIQLMAKDLIEIISTQFKAQVDQAFIGRNAAYSAVLAENLQSAFDAHAHVSALPGQPTSPPVIPLSALAGTAMDIAAQKVKIKGNIG
jgi:hypothetical protein